MAKKRINGQAIPKKEIEASRERVLKLAQLGCTDYEIGFVIEMSESSVKKHYRAELDKARANLRASLRKSQLELAINEKNSSMLIWLGKNYLGQKDPKQSFEHSGKIIVEKVMYGVADKKKK